MHFNDRQLYRYVLWLNYEDIDVQNIMQKIGESFLCEMSKMVFVIGFGFVKNTIKNISAKSNKLQVLPSPIDMCFERMKRVDR